MFLTYREYDKMGGTLDEEVYARYEYKARAYINRMSHNRIRDETPVRECVQQLMFELIGLFYSKEESEGNGVSGVSSKSNDGISVTYADASSVERQWNRKFGNLLIEYLADQVKDGVPLLYGGVQFDSIRE